VAFNHLKSSKLHNGQSLIVDQGTPTKIATKSSSVKPTKLAAKTEKMRYIVKRGETLASIARKFNVATGDLQRWNKMNHSRITAGHTLTIYRPDSA
jgi:membrane-bound lytic murein transglycosylase D